MELDHASISYSRSGRLIMHVNKVHHVTTINRVAKDLGETEDWLSDVANEMDIEDGVIWGMAPVRPTCLRADETHLAGINRVSWPSFWSTRLR